MVTMYDVRYTADSVFERFCKAIHLGVMVGFAESGTSFDPHDQIKTIFQTLSLFLAVSRLTLGLQYSLVAFQVRKYAYGKRPLIMTAALHFIAAAIYFGVSFRYEVGKNSRVYIMWVSDFRDQPASSGPPPSASWFAAGNSSTRDQIWNSRTIAKLYMRRAIAKPTFYST